MIALSVDLILILPFLIFDQFSHLMVVMQAWETTANVQYQNDEPLKCHPFNKIINFFNSTKKASEMIQLRKNGDKEQEITFLERRRELK